VVLITLLAFVGQVVSVPSNSCSADKMYRLTEMNHMEMMNHTDSSATMDMECCDMQCECIGDYCSTAVFIIANNSDHSVSILQTAHQTPYSLPILKTSSSSIFHPPILS